MGKRRVEGIKLEIELNNITAEGKMEIHWRNGWDLDETSMKKSTQKKHEKQH